MSNSRAFRRQVQQATYGRRRMKQFPFMVTLKSKPYNASYWGENETRQRAVAWRARFQANASIREGRRNRRAQRRAAGLARQQSDS